jgi:carbamate kinase
VPQRLAIAIGGTATHPEMITGTSAEQKEIAKQTAEPLLPKLRGGCKSLIAHDNAA